ncbi:hypothetical protein L6R50_12775 [Myxococcota bacterium]|nr:hypothetical protein [Myxococcota bacterium]
MQTQKGERYACEHCGAEIEIVKACECPPVPGKHSHLCCGEEMKKVREAPTAGASRAGAPPAS